jgi:hypothetical protein
MELWTQTAASPRRMAQRAHELNKIMVWAQFQLGADS